MKNFKVNYQLDGIGYLEVVEAETGEEAATLIEQQNFGSIVKGVEPTTEPTTEDTTAAFLEKVGATSVLEWLAYQEYCKPLYEAAVAKSMEELDEAEEEAERTGDWTRYYELYDGKTDYNPPTIEEWRKMNK